MDRDRQRAAREAMSLQSELRRLPLPSSDPRWGPVRDFLGPGGDLDKVLAAPDPPVGDTWASVADRLCWLHTRIAWVLSHHFGQPPVRELPWPGYFPGPSPYVTD